MESMHGHFKVLFDNYLTDSNFREKFQQDRVKATESLGIRITPEIEKALRELDSTSIERLADQLSGRPCLT